MKKATGKKTPGKVEGKTVGARIRSIRGEMTQQKLAETLRIKQAMISRYESNKETPSPRVLMRMAKFAGISIEQLLTGEELLKVKSGPARKKAGMSKQDLLDLAADDVRRTRLPEAEEFAEMMIDLSKDRRRIRKVLDYYRFLKDEE